jgi:hypothetical protein
MVAAPAPARAPVALATLALVIASAALLGILHLMSVNNRLEAKVQALEASQSGDDRAHGRLNRSVEVLGNAVTLLSDEQVDLTNQKLQHLRHGFAISELNIARQDTGVLVQGRMINASSLRYRDATFRAKVGNSNKEFTISNLPPGSSGAFEVVLPNLALENARTATFSLVSSAVEYAR